VPELAGPACGCHLLLIMTTGRHEKDFVGWPPCLRDMGGWHGTPASPLLRRRGPMPAGLNRLPPKRKVEYLPAVAQPANPRGPRRGSRAFQLMHRRLSRNRVDARPAKPFLDHARMALVQAGKAAQRSGGV